MNVLALFAGVGGLELGIKIARPDARTVCYVEREAYAAATLVARMEDEALDPAPVWDDVTTFDGVAWRGRVDLIAGGFPCQDISAAGKGEGIKEGNRSGLWFEFARIIREVRPRFVFVENVAALLARGIDRVLGDLAEMGFDAVWRSVTAEQVGAPHRRERIFILAYSHATEQWGPAQQEETEGDIGDLAHGKSGGRGERGKSSGSDGQPDRSNKELADASGERSREEGRLQPKRPEDGDSGSGGEMATRGDSGHQLPEASSERIGQRILGDDGEVRKGTRDHSGDALGGRELGDSERRRREGRNEHGAETEESGPGCNPFPPGPSDAEGWKQLLAIDPSLEPAICRSADGMGSRVDRLRAAGNGVCSLAAAYAFRTLWARMIEVTR